MNYPDSVRYLYSLGNETRTIKLGLERIRTLLEALGNPHRACQFVHVAGTNGKGSTCAMIESGLRAAGLRTGLYTSPHLNDPTERIRIDGAPVDTSLFVGAFDLVHDTAERLVAAQVLDFHPTYFETITAMAFVIFREQRVDTAALEVGLGGRLDATNVVTPRLAVITPIDYDHQEYLGHTLAAIAAEKAGILKPGVAAVFAHQQPAASTVLHARASELGIPVTRAEDWTMRDLTVEAHGSRFIAAGRREICVTCPLPGEHQAENALTAAVALDALGIEPHAIDRGLRETGWPGRLERVSSAPDIYLDGAHNPAGAAALAAYIRRFHAARRLWLIFGVMRDKDVREISEILFPLASELILTAPAQARAMNPTQMHALPAAAPAHVTENVPQALALLAAAAPDDVVFITGSLFLVGEARALLARVQ